MAKSYIPVKPLRDRVLIGIYDDGSAPLMLGGKEFFTYDDVKLSERNNGKEKHKGIRSRWGIVLATPDNAKDDEVVPGEKVYLEQLQWSFSIPCTVDGEVTKIWSIPMEAILGSCGTDFTDAERNQITKLYPNWENWTVRDL